MKPESSQNTADAARIGSTGGSGLRRITPMAWGAAKEFCTYTRQEDSTEQRLAEIIQGVIDRTQRAMALGAQIAESDRKDDPNAEATNTTPQKS